MRNLRLQSEKGASLVEIIIVILIVGFILLVVSNIPSSIFLIGSSKYQSTAKQVASSKMEDLRVQGYDNLANGVVVISDPRLNTLPGGTGTIDVSDCPSTLCSNGEEIKKVRVKIDWQESGKPKTIEINTLISKGGLL
jgi:Tfp pilus assembly protein PilV